MVVGRGGEERIGEKREEEEEEVKWEGKKKSSGVVGGGGRPLLSATGDLLLSSIYVCMYASNLSGSVSCFLFFDVFLFFFQYSVCHPGFLLIGSYYKSPLEIPSTALIHPPS